MQKRMYTQLDLIRKEVHEQVWFPTNSQDGYIFRYGMAVLLGLITILYILVSPLEMKTSAYLLLCLAVGMSSFFGNMRTALFVLTLSLSTVVFRYYSDFDISLFFIEIGFLVVSTIGLSLLIQHSKRMKIILEFATRQRQLKEEIAQLTVEKAHALQEIQIRDEFISIASHELKTPLTTTLLKLQTALHNVRHVTLANFSVQNLLDMLESAELQTKRLGKMINDLLNISIIRTGRLELEKESCDAREIIDEVVHRFTEKAQKDGITIRISKGNPVLGEFDKVRLEQVTANLISNALKYGNKKPVDVTVEKRGSVVRIGVKDYGIGIPKEKKEKVFNLFERAVGNNEYRGLGIGLYITKQIVVAHGGSMRVESKMHKGSEFIVEIPLGKKER